MIVGPATETSRATRESAASDALANELLAVVRALADELAPDRRPAAPVQLDSELDRDLGLDSLARAELIARVSDELDVELPDDLLGTAETPLDLLAAVLRAPHARREVPDPAATAARTGPSESAPARATSLSEVLAWHIEHHPDRSHVILTDGDRDSSAITYGELDRAAREVAAGLRDRGKRPGERIAIMLPTGEEFFAAFFGALYAGCVPVPLYPPGRLSQLGEHLRRQAAILENAGASLLVAFPEAARVGTILRAQVSSLREVETVSRLRAAPAAEMPAPARPDDLALLQYTSGSTGDPKGVALSHRNLLANIRAMLAVLGIGSGDLIVSWLPLYHDMGLIGSWLGGLYAAAPVAMMSPVAFLTRPVRWLRAISRHRGTVSAAPNFAYELCARKVKDEDLVDLDLASWRLALNGAEPVSPTTLRRFADRFACSGFQEGALMPVYGLAECSVGLAFPPLGRGPWIDRVDRTELLRHGRATPSAASPGETALEVVACGLPLPGHEIRVVDETGRELGPRVEGDLEFRGPSATTGYYRAPDKTRALFDGEWLRTGDKGYIASGEVFITGRHKDMLIRAGRNLYPQELEELVGNVEGVRKGCVAVFGGADPASGTERLVVVAETRETEVERRAAIRRRIASASLAVLDLPPDEVVLAPPHAVQKTSSGKIRRSATRELYERGRLDAVRFSDRTQLVRLILASWVARARVMVRRSRALFYAGYFWALAAVLAVSAWLLLVAMPGRRLRSAFVHRLTRWFLAASFLPLEVDGADRLPPGGGLLIANHASYLDGVVLAAALPGRLVFLAKRELAEHFLTRVLLGRAGALFVDRYDPSRAVEDARKAAVVARSGARLVVFAEGTTTRRPGLAGFRLGGFAVAADSGLPVRPVVIHGTRAVLRSEAWFPRRAAIAVEVGPEMRAEGSGLGPAAALRDRVRAYILERCGEPDLAGEEHPLVTKLRQKRQRDTEP